MGEEELTESDQRCIETIMEITAEFRRDMCVLELEKWAPGGRPVEELRERAREYVKGYLKALVQKAIMCALGEGFVSGGKSYISEFVTGEQPPAPPGFVMRAVEEGLRLRRKKADGE